MNSLEMLNSILEQQRAQLDLILVEQKKIRKDVTTRNWEDLEAHIVTLNYLSQQFSVWKSSVQKRMQRQRKMQMEKISCLEILFSTWFIRNLRHHELRMMH